MLKCVSGFVGQTEEEVRPRKQTGGGNPCETFRSVVQAFTLPHDAVPPQSPASKSAFASACSVPTDAGGGCGSPGGGSVVLTTGATHVILFHGPKPSRTPPTLTAIFPPSIFITVSMMSQAPNTRTKPISVLKIIFFPFWARVTLPCVDEMNMSAPPQMSAITMTMGVISHQV